MEGRADGLPSIRWALAYHVGDMLTGKTQDIYVKLDPGGGQASELVLNKSIWPVANPSARGSGKVIPICGPKRC
jgi:hypothetical protein